MPRATSGGWNFQPGGETHRDRPISSVGTPIENKPDFLGWMMAFREGGRRVDFLALYKIRRPTTTTKTYGRPERYRRAAGAEVPLVGGWVL